MTKPEKLGTRDLSFSRWIRKNLPASNTGFCCTDLDFILQNYKTKKLLLLETKTFNGRLGEWQEILFNNINRWIKKGIEVFDPYWDYQGFHIIRFPKEPWGFKQSHKIRFKEGDDKKCYFDDEEKTEEELIAILKGFNIVIEFQEGHSDDAYVGDRECFFDDQLKTEKEIIEILSLK